MENSPTITKAAADMIKNIESHGECWLSVGCLAYDNKSLRQLKRDGLVATKKGQVTRKYHRSFSENHYRVTA